MSIFNEDDIKKSTDSDLLEVFAKKYICGQNEITPITSALLKDDEFGYYRCYNFHARIFKTKPLHIIPGDNIYIVDEDLGEVYLRIYACEAKIKDNSIIFIQSHCISRSKIFIYGFDGYDIDYIDMKIKTKLGLLDVVADDIICINCPNLKTYKKEIIKNNFNGKIVDPNLMTMKHIKYRI